MKRILAALTSVILVAALFAGCYNDSDVLVVDGYGIYPGLYLFFQIQAISEASAEFEGQYSGTELFEQTIEEVPARDWISGRTAEIAKEYVFVQREFERLGLEEDSVRLEMDFSESQLRSEWTQLSYFYTRNGIGYETYYRAYEYQIRTNRVFSALYVDEGGERLPPDDEVIDYFSDNYTYLDYVKAAKTGEGGIALTEEELNELGALTDGMLADAKQAAEGAGALYADGQNVGIEAAFERYLLENGVEAELESLRSSMVVEQVIVTPDSAANYDEGFVTEVFESPYDEYQIFESDSSYYLFCRRSMLESNADAWQDYRGNVIGAIRSEDFLNYIAENGEVLEISEDSGARKYFSIDKAYAV